MVRIDNTQGVQRIEFKLHVVCFCTIGKEWYNMDVRCIVDVGDYYPDYCDIQRYINDNIQGKGLTIEDALFKVKEFMGQYNFKHTQVIGETSGIKGHPDVIVTL